MPMMPLFAPAARSRWLRVAAERALLGCGAALLSAVTVAQLTVDQVPLGRTVPIAEQVEQEMESSRLRLGPLRVIPMIEVSNAGYDSNVYSDPVGEEKTADYTATVGLGARAILPMGSKLYLRLLALPEYIWYDQLQDRRNWGGNFAASFLALGNRLSFRALGGFDKGSSILNSETQANVLETTERASGNVEVGLTHSLSFIAGGEVQQLRYAPESVNVIDVEKFNRTDGAIISGLRLRLSSAVIISAGAQGTRSVFVPQGALPPEEQLQDNQTLAYLGGFRYERPRFYVDIAGGYRKARAYNDSTFPDFSTTVGSYYVSWDVASPVEIQAYGHRRPVYSRFAINQFYIETRNGGALRFRVGQRVALRGYAEAGTNAYPYNVLGGVGSARRVDDAVTYGGSLSVLVFGTTIVRAQAYQNITQPSLVGSLERKVFRFFTGLSFSGDLTKE